MLTKTAIIETASWRDLNALRHLEQVFPAGFLPLLDLIGVLTFPGVVRLKAVLGDTMVSFIAGDIGMDGNWDGSPLWLYCRISETRYRQPITGRIAKN
jgi:hypothetical protein